MTPYFRKMVWAPLFLASAALFIILGSAVRAHSWRLLWSEGVMVLAVLGLILWLLQSVRGGEPGQHSGREAAILLLLLLIVAAGAVQVLFRG